MNTRNVLTVVAIILALLLAGVGWWGYGLKKDKEKLAVENDKMESEISGLESLKTELEAEVDSLALAYEVLTIENDSLSSSLTDAQARLVRRDATIRQLNRQQVRSVDNAEGLRAQIQSLLAAKSELENQIVDLQTENEALREEAGLLKVDLSKAREDNLALANLNRTMQSELDKLTLANFKATAFQVEVERRRSKVTVKGRRAKRIKASFDLTNVPEKYQGVRPLYLVITDEKATPIQLENPIKAQVVVNGQANDIIAAEQKEVNIGANQRLSFSHELDKRLRKGYYRVIVYTDIGVLGASSFRMR